MDGFSPNSGVILIVATNRPDVLDSALLRPGRLDRRVVVDLPDIKGREEILRLHSKKVVLAKEADLGLLARRTPGFSGADLANIINEAALLAGRRGKKAVSPDELEEAMERVMSGPERRSRVLSDKEKRIVAYHESGHALVARLTPRTNPIHKVTIIPRGHALGITMSIPLEDRFLSTEPEMLAELMVLLGGRTSEEIVFNEISTGAQNDLDRATEMARRMVCSYGMSKRIGALTLGRGQEAVFLGRDLLREKDYSEETAVAIDEEIRRLVEEAHRKVADLLRKHRKQLESLAKALLEKETVEADELDRILGLPSAKPHPAPEKAAAKHNGKRASEAERAPAPASGPELAGGQPG
jgi:cell division protease FtsH